MFFQKHRDVFFEAIPWGAYKNRQEWLFDRLSLVMQERK